MSGYRIARRGRVDPARSLSFTFDGKAMKGIPGDTLASALLAGGVMLVGRSFKYHRPRGLLGAGVEEPNALFGVDRGFGRSTPNVRATSIELHAGLAVETQNRWPSLGFDLGAATNLLSPLFPAGFYNKTFMWPRAAWEKVYEPAIRRMAGLGKAPDAIDADRYTATHDFVDLLVVGAGRAGIEAALAAATNGERVMLVDEQAEPGGKTLSDPARWGWLENALAQLRVAGGGLPAAHHRDRAVSRRLRRRGRAADRSCRTRGGYGAAGAVAPHPCGADPAGDRRDRAAAGFRRQ